jgi:ribosomal-protein-alanine N-acetyltransferase
MPRLPVLQTERLVLRPMVAADASWFAEMLADPEVKRLTLESALPAAQAAKAAPVLVWFHGHRAYWAITLGGEPCGFICLTQTGQLGPRGAYAGFELRRAYWGRGIATEALRAVIDCAFDFFGLDAVRAAAIHGNAASVRVLEKAGLHRGGQHRLPGDKPADWFVLHRSETGRAAVRGAWVRLRYFWLGARLLV